MPSIWLHKQLKAHVLQDPATSFSNSEGFFGSHDNLLDCDSALGSTIQSLPATLSYQSLYHRSSSSDDDSFTLQSRGTEPTSLAWEPLAAKASMLDSDAVRTFIMQLTHVDRHVQDLLIKRAEQAPVHVSLVHKVC